MKQEISALMDGELEAHEAEAIVRACYADEGRKRTWYLYHAIGETMRGRAPASLEVPAGVTAKLREQPTVLAPRARMQATVVRVALAAAASVATVGVVGWIGSQGGTGAPVPVVAKIASPIRPVASTAPVLGTAPVAAPMVVPMPALNVQEYLVAHRQVMSPDLYRPVTNRATAVAR